MGKAVDEHKTVQAYRQDWKHLVVFDEVDVGIAIERDVAVQKVPLGGLASKPGVIDGRISIRECLCMTLGFDHRIIDGGPAARFAERLRELVESGYGLEDSMTASE